MKVSVIFGTRPEAIKLAPVIVLLKKKKNIQCNVCVTAQHREMLDQILDVFRIIPDVDLNIMQHNQSLPDLTARLLIAITAYLKREKPDIVIVQGDTTSAFVGALAAFYAEIPVAHVEAGLRTGNLRSPWPEEANRQFISRIAQFHFAPNDINRRNLILEGVPTEKIFITGNTVVDALLMTVKKIERSPNVTIPIISGLNIKKKAKDFVLITGHRRENFGNGFRSICKAITILAGRFPDIDFVYPVHMNPKVRDVVTRMLNGTKKFRNVYIIDPVPYPMFVALMNRCRLILTDSGGIQEEAPSLGKPVLVMRNTTERPEAISAGAAILVGTSTPAICKEVTRLLTDEKTYRKMSKVRNPYGDGKAARRITEILLKAGVPG